MADSRSDTRAAQQRTTREWWDTQRPRFELLTSQLVIVEASEGDPTAAAHRLQALREIPLVDVTDEAAAVANALVGVGAIPNNALRDALHIGICAASGLDYRLTWNFTHLANAALRNRINDVCMEQGYVPPAICTPDELFEGAP